jgi:branched-chain amino acid transport system permease protein
VKNALILASFLFLPCIFFRGEHTYYLFLLTMGSMWAIVALSLNLLLGYTGQISLCHAAFFGIGAYAAAIAGVNFSLNPWIGLAASVVCPALVALVAGFPTVRLKEHYLAMATLGIGVIVYAVLRANPFGATGGPGGIFAIPSLSILGYNIDTDMSRHITVSLVLIVVFMLCQSLVGSRFGSLMKAVHESQNAVVSLGIDVNRVKLKIFALSAAMAGLAGGLYSYCSPLSYINPDDVASVMLSVKFIVMVVIGGTMSLAGGGAGAFIVTWLPDLLRAASGKVPLVNPADLEAVIYGAVLIATLIYAPQGLLRIGGRRA